MAQIQLMPAAIAAGVGAADGWAARRDLTDPTRYASQMRQWSFWLEGASLIGGLFLNYQARTARAEETAESLIHTGAALLGRRAGVSVAERNESPVPLAFAGAPPAGVAAPQVFGAMRAGAGQYYPSASERARQEALRAGA